MKAPVARRARAAGVDGDAYEASGECERRWSVGALARGVRAARGPLRSGADSERADVPGQLPGDRASLLRRGRRAGAARGERRGQRERRRRDGRGARVRRRGQRVQRRVRAHRERSSALRTVRNGVRSGRGRARFVRDGAVPERVPRGVRARGNGVRGEGPAADRADEHELCVEPAADAALGGSRGRRRGGGRSVFEPRLRDGGAARRGERRRGELAR